MADEGQDFVVLGRKDVQDFNPQGVLPLSQDQILQIQSFLNPTQYAATSSEWGKHSTAHLSGTGTWVFDTQQYQQWHNSTKGGLWIKGIAGAGKSVIAATVVSKLAAEENVPVLYFFFRHIVSTNQKPKALVCDFLSQLLQYCPQLQHTLFKIFIEDRRTLGGVSFDSLWDMLASSLAQLPRAYCIVDALDEMDAGNEAFLDKLVALTDKSSTSIKVLVTSRPIPRIESHLRSTDLLHLVLQPHLVAPDISIYIRHRLNQQAMAPTTRSLIHETMCGKAEGHFLYARLMMDDLLDPSKDVISHEGKLLVALDSLPAPMEDMYTQILLEHSQRSGTPQDLQVTLLEWITQAERPLRLLELSSLIDIADFSPQVRKDAKSVIREACGPLLEVFEDETVHPIHHSFTEFLYNKTQLDSCPSSLPFPVLAIDEAQRALAVRCLQYLASGWHRQWLDLEPRPSDRRSRSGRFGDKNVMKLRFPCLDYAVTNWHHHMHKSKANDNTITAALCKVFTEDGDLLHAWLDWKVDKSSFSFYDETRDDRSTWSPLHAAAQVGLTHFVEFLIQQGYGIEQSTSAGQTPLAIAALHGHHGVVRLLLERGAKSDEPDDAGLKPLHHSARANKSKVVKLLLEAGVNPYTPKTKEHPGNWCGSGPSSVGESPVEYACLAGNLETMKVMIPWLDGGGLQKALYWSLSFGKTEIVREILQRSEVQVNHYLEDQTPLFLAASAQDLKTMRLLLDMGADANLLSGEFIERHHFPLRFGPNERSLSPLHILLRRFNESGTRLGAREDALAMQEGVSMLLDAGIDPNITDPNGLTLLDILLSPRDPLTAKKAGSSQTVKAVMMLLLERGLSSTAATNALCRAAAVCPPEILDILIDLGAEVNMTGKGSDESPLMTAVRAGQMDVACYLVQKGANVNVFDNHGNTLLHCERGRPDIRVEMAKMLIEAGADVHARNKDGNMPLHTRNIDLEMTSLFLRYGFNPESKNRLGQTLLFHSLSQFATLHHCEELIGLGCDPLTRDNRGGTLLHGLYQHMNSNTSDVFRYLVAKGVDAQSTDLEGNNLWHVVAGVETFFRAEDQLSAMKVLMEYGVSPTARNIAGQTPLHIAFSVGADWALHGPLEFLLTHTRADIEASDHDQVRPLHLVASHDLRSTCVLLKRGADCTATTIEGQTPLMVACRTRHSDIVCAILDHYRRNGILHLVDQADHNGQTALHHACRSGRPETAALLLEAGAGANSKDKKNTGPLHKCAEYLEEDALWSDPRTSPQISTRPVKAVYVLSTDSMRPKAQNSNSGPVRGRETVRLLVQHGADTSFLITEEDKNSPEWMRSIIKGTYSHDPLAYAITRACSPVVSELLLIQEKLRQEGTGKHSATTMDEVHMRGISPETTGGHKPWPEKISNLHDKLSFFTMQYMPDFIKDATEPGQNNSFLATRLLERDDELGVKQMITHGARFSLGGDRGESFPERLAAWGFAALLEDVGGHAAHETATLAGEVESQDVDRKNNPWHSVLRAALNRAIPNMPVVKAIVPRFEHDVNRTFQYGSSVQTYAHMLARPSHWWQTKALAYLLENGAMVDLPDSEGATPLIRALPPNYGNTRDPTRIAAIKVLLEHGANPNAVDNNGLTCLNIAAQQPECVQLLFKYGADPSHGSRSFLLDALKAQDLESIKYIVASGANINRQSQLVAEPEDRPSTIRGGGGSPHVTPPRSDVKVWSTSHSFDDLSAHAYPIHVAASKFFNSAEKIARARQIIELLLQGGADPFLTYEDGSSIISCLARNNGILRPFLSIPSFDTEIRDAEGRTLLLAACSFMDTMYVHSAFAFDRGDSIETLINHGASITAVDDRERNALHILIDSFPRFSRFGHNFDKDQAAFEHFLPSLLSRCDSAGRTPYHYALSKQRIDIVQFLLDRGSDPSVLDPSDNTTALHHLAPKLVFPHHASDTDMNPLSRLLTRLVSCGIPINGLDDSGETPAFKLARTGLLDFDRATEVSSAWGTPQLLCAFQTLEALGANFGNRNSAGESILHHLAMHVEKRPGALGEDSDRVRDLQESFKWLVGKGPDVTWEDIEQRTCLDVAAASGATWLTKLYERE